MKKQSRPAIIILSVIATCSLIVVAVMSFLKSDTVSQSCVLNATRCDIATSQGSVSLKLDKPPAPEEQISFALTLPAQYIVQDISLEGDDMYMGKVPVFIKNHAQSKLEGWFMLGSCSNGAMRWRMQVKIKGLEDPLLIYLDV